jgi:hypothetical protein
MMEMGVGPACAQCDGSGDNRHSQQVLRQFQSQHLVLAPL